MQIGVPKEIKSDEYRVGMTPTSVREAVHHGHTVFVETDAGEAIGLHDADYEKAGAALAPYQRFSEAMRYVTEHYGRKITSDRLARMKGRPSSKLKRARVLRFHAAAVFRPGLLYGPWQGPGS